VAAEGKRLPPSSKNSGPYLRPPTAAGGAGDVKEDQPARRFSANSRIVALDLVLDRCIFARIAATSMTVKMSAGGKVSSMRSNPLAV
jgi:hypothetical protein